MILFFYMQSTPIWLKAESSWQLINVRILEETNG